MFQPIRVIAASLLVPATIAAIAITNQSAASATVHHATAGGGTYHATAGGGNWHATTDAVIRAAHGSWSAAGNGKWS